METILSAEEFGIDYKKTSSRKNVQEISTGNNIALTLDNVDEIIKDLKENSDLWKRFF